MKKILFSLLALLLILILLGAFAWVQRSSLISFFLTNSIGAPASIRTLLFHKGGLEISDFHVRNIPPCKISNALFVEEISCKATLRSILQHKVEIESIHFKDILLGIEFLTPKGDQNNWTLILSNCKEKKKSSRPYLIRSLVFDHIHVTVTDIKGGTKKIPTIDHLEFQNISDESGIPFQQIEKAIFQSMLQTIFKQLGIKTIMKLLNPYSLPKLFRFPFLFSNENLSRPENFLSQEERTIAE